MFFFKSIINNLYIFYCIFRLIESQNVNEKRNQSLDTSRPESFVSSTVVADIDDAFLDNVTSPARLV